MIGKRNWRWLRLAKYLTLIVLLNTLLSCYTLAQNRYEITVSRWKDADTCVADIALGFGVVLKDQEIRCNDYDAWEASNRRKSVKYYPNEVEQGLLATEEVRAYTKGKRLYIIPDLKEERDNYGRILGTIVVTYGDQEAILLREWTRDRGHHRHDKQADKAGIRSGESSGTNPTEGSSTKESQK